MHKGLIAIPDNIQDKHTSRVPEWGEVISVTGVPMTKSGKPYPRDFDVGDRVFIEPYSATFVEINGERLLRCPIHKVLAKIENVKLPPQK
jgi:co-chaperonin GroES (HSP10)